MHRKHGQQPHTFVISKNGKASAKIMGSRVAETEIDNSFTTVHNREEDKTECVNRRVFH